MTVYVTEIEAVEEHATASEDACEGIWGLPCDATATVGQVHLCCGWVRKLCEEHAGRTRDWIEQAAAAYEYPTLQCMLCGLTIPLKNWRTMVRFDPL